MQKPGPVVARLLLAICCYFFLSGVMQSLVSLLGVAAGIGGLELGLALGLASGAIGIVLDMPIAVRADSRGKRRVAEIGLFCSCVASLTLLAHGSAPLLIAALLLGIGACSAPSALLSWLGSVVPLAGQAKVQGINASGQRMGGLTAAAIVGIGIAVHLPALMAVSAALVSLTALLLIHGPAMHPTDIATAAVHGIADSYRRGLRMLGERKLALAAGTNVGINVILLETNSYVPLAHGPNRAIIVAGALVARDLTAIVVGVGIAAAGVNVASAAAVAGALSIAGLCAWASGAATGSLVLIALDGLQGAAIGMCVVAANLFTIGAIPAQQRTLAMAVSVLPTRLMFLILPIGSSVVLRTAGLPDVFRLLGVMLLGLAGATLLLGSSAIRSNGTRPDEDGGDAGVPSI
jgi:hypothetical protein